MIQFISTYHLDGFPTESFIELINTRLESLLDEVFLTSVLAIVTNIIKNQPHAEIALEFAITNGDTASFGRFEKNTQTCIIKVSYQYLLKFSTTIYQGFISS